MELNDDAGELRYRVALTVMGLAATVRSNQAAVIEAVQRWFRSADEAVQTVALQIDVIAAIEIEATVSGGGMTWRRHGPTAVAAYGANLLTAQHDRGYGLAFVTPALIAAGDRLVAEVIEPLALELARGQGYVPLRATALGATTTVVLIAHGPDVEMAALIQACTDAGLPLVAEQTLYVSRGDGVRIWGTRGMDGAGMTAVAGLLLVCVVERIAGRVSRLERVDAPVVLPLVQGAGADVATAQALIQRGVYRLLMGSEPRNAAALLAHLVAAAGR